MKALLITPDHVVKTVEIDSGLASLQKAVGGMIEYIPISDEVHAFIDEEGKLKGKEINTIATMVCRKLEVGLQPDDMIVGDMIILGSLNADGQSDGSSYDVPDSFGHPWLERN